MELTSEDFEEAASLYNQCRENGIQGSGTDFLICAVAAKHDYSIFTTAADFTHFAKALPIVLHQP
jgi:predicted nucleic acid-binding protein